jgi:hypothetical protein
MKSSTNMSPRTFALEMISLAKNRGEDLPYDKAFVAARAGAYLKGHGRKVDINNLWKLSGQERLAARSFVVILPECKGIDPMPYLQGLQRLDVADIQNAAARCRPWPSQTAVPYGSVKPSQNELASWQTIVPASLCPDPSIKEH